MLLLATLTSQAAINQEQSDSQESYDFVQADAGSTLAPTYGAEAADGNLLATATENFGNRFAVGPKARNNGNDAGFIFRTAGDWKGLWSKYADRTFTILNLKAGDKYAITISKDEEKLKFTASGDLVVSGKEYTVEADGNVSFTSLAGVYIESVSITPYVAPAPGTTETVSVGMPAADDTYNLVQVASGTIELPTWGTEVSSGGVTLNMLAYGSNTFDNKIAVGPTSRNNDSGNCFKFRTAGDYKGLWSQYADRNITILNLTKGDRVTIVTSKSEETLQVVGGDAVVSGEPITMTSNGNLDLVSTGSVYIESIRIERDAVNTGGSTLVSSNALDFSEVTDIKAYVATNVATDKVTFTQVERVAANTPLYLTADDAVSVEVPILTNSEMAETISTNYLKGSPTSATVLDPTAATYYLYGIGENGAGFYQLGGTANVSSAEGKAYLEAPAGLTPARFLQVDFEDGSSTTVIKTLDYAQYATGNGVYDLYGRRIDSSMLNKGLYIVNGKKMIIK